MAKVEIIGVESPSTAERGPFDPFRGATKTEIDSAELAANWSEFSAVLGDVFAASPEIDGFGIDEIKVSISISASGKFQFIAGGSVGAEAALEVTIKRLKD